MQYGFYVILKRGIRLHYIFKVRQLYGIFIFSDERNGKIPHYEKQLNKEMKLCNR